MNERIKELSRQANAHKLDWAYYRGEKKPENAVTLHSIDLELFAELIVKECADYITESASIETLLGKKLLEHFGVVE